MIGLMVLVGLLGSFVFEGDFLLPVLTVLFVFYGVPALHRHVVARTFDDPVQRAALLVALSSFVLGVLAACAEHR